MCGGRQSGAATARLLPAGAAGCAGCAASLYHAAGGASGGGGALASERVSGGRRWQEPPQGFSGYPSFEERMRVSAHHGEGGAPQRAKCFMHGTSSALSLSMQF